MYEHSIEELSIQLPKFQRFGYFEVSCTLAKVLLGEELYSSLWKEPQTKEFLDKICKKFLLPSNCRVDGVSPHYLVDAYLFVQNKLMVRVECEDFSPISEGQRIPMYLPFYTSLPTGKFSHWEELPKKQ